MKSASAGAPDLVAPPALVDWIASRCAADAVANIETAALSGQLDDAFLSSVACNELERKAASIWKEHDHLVVRGAPAAADGVSLVLLSRVLCRRFKSYRGDKIVKHFRMSPWTTDLSHTLQEGHFHTDINTSPEPPLVTAIQCLVADPGAPAFGENRVARLPDLLDALRDAGASRTLAFLRDTDVTMVNDASPADWVGRIVANGGIRFHPETLRMAQRRHGNLPNDLEDCLAAIKEVALTVSKPIHLAVGDALFVSNTRALHYRGACSVLYQSFPRDFTAREIYALHLLDEPT